MKEHEEFCNNFIDILKNKEIQNYANDGFMDFIQAVFTGDAFSGFSAIKNVKDLVFSIPNLRFWSKMERFLLGTFRDFEDQIKMSNKFSDDNGAYQEYIEQLLETIDKLDANVKVDYYSHLTRSLMAELIDFDLYYKLCQMLKNCTVSELKFINEHKDNEHLEYDIMIFSLKNYGLVEQIIEDEKSRYIFTDLAKKLKEHAINDDDIPKHKTAYREIIPPEDDEPITRADIDKMFDDNDVIINVTN